MSGSPSAAAPTTFIEIPAGTIAYRRFGRDGGIPLVLTNRFRGTMDHWDPALLDSLASDRHVIIFDSAGVGSSSGEVPPSITGMAQIAGDFIDALGHDEVDVLGWSMGGAVAQRLTLDRPQLVRRLVLAGTGPGAVPDGPPPAQEPWQIAAKPVNDDEDFLYMFFADSDESRSAGLASLRRLDERLTASMSTVKPESVQAQLTAIRGWVTGTDSSYEDLAKITIPVFVGTGARDVLVHPYGSYVVSQRLPDARLTLYPDSSHAFLFQHHAQFSEDVLRFLH
jgi:pimeloyl-ACP methyl ester carboxylesterase